MEFFRRYFWVVQGVVVALCAFLLAKTINLIIGYQLEKRFTISPPKVSSRPLFKGLEEDINFSEANGRNIFGAEREDIAWEDIINADEGENGSWENAVATTLPYQLVGTSVFEDSSQSLATIIETGKDSMPHTYSLNECSSGYENEDSDLRRILSSLAGPSLQVCNRLGDVGTIRRIEQTKVYFYNDNQRRYEYLSLEAGERYKPPVSAHKPRAEADDLSGLGSSVREIAPNSYEISEDDLEEALSNLAQISLQARAIPAIENGKSVGFKMVSITPGSVFDKIGLKVGDIVTRVNGYDLNSPDKALEVYQKLRTAKRFNVDFKRGDKPMTFNYSVVP